MLHIQSLWRESNSPLGVSMAADQGAELRRWASSLSNWHQVVYRFCLVVSGHEGLSVVKIISSFGCSLWRESSSSIALCPLHPLSSLCCKVVTVYNENVFWIKTKQVFMLYLVNHCKDAALYVTTWTEDAIYLSWQLSSFFNERTLLNWTINKFSFQAIVYSIQYIYTNGKGALVTRHSRMSPSSRSGPRLGAW